MILVFFTADATAAAAASVRIGGQVSTVDGLIKKSTGGVRGM